VKREITTIGFMAVSFDGCGSVFPKPSPSRLYALSPLSQAGADMDHPRQISLGIGPVRLPGYLDRQEIVTRAGSNRFDLFEYDRWAEPLDENFTRVLTQNLSILLRTDRIVAYPWPLDTKPRYRVEIQVLRFESNSAREAELSARWAVIDETGKEAPNLKESRLTRPAKEKSIDAAVAALSETVEDLSREIAKTVMAIDRERGP
jgi:uncharacterized lipoprotein YmbA